MFWQGHEDDVEFPSSHEPGSGDRFEARIRGFRQRGAPVYKHHVWWLIHNCVSHPLIGLAPVKWAFAFHDWTSRKINGH